MPGRGRKSAAELATPFSIIPGARPEPPTDLTDEQADEWRAIVSRMPSDWFPRETHPVLAELCFYIVRARDLRKKLGADGLEPALDTLLSDQHDKAAAKILAHSRSMRLTQQSRYDKTKTTGNATQKRRPWEKTA
jgi:hypothetical protein